MLGCKRIREFFCCVSVRDIPACEELRIWKIPKEILCGLSKMSRKYATPATLFLQIFSHFWWTQKPSNLEKKKSINYEPQSSATANSFNSSTGTSLKLALRLSCLIELDIFRIHCSKCLRSFTDWWDCIFCTMKKMTSIFSELSETFFEMVVMQLMMVLQSFSESWVFFVATESATITSATKGMANSMNDTIGTLIIASNIWMTTRVIWILVTSLGTADKYLKRMVIISWVRWG